MMNAQPKVQEFIIARIFLKTEGLHRTRAINATGLQIHATGLFFSPWTSAVLYLLLCLNLYEQICLLCNHEIIHHSRVNHIHFHFCQSYLL